MEPLDMKPAKYRRLIALSLAASFFLAACGIRGDLKRPDPLWGKKPHAEDTAEKPVGENS